MYEKILEALESCQLSDDLSVGNAAGNVLSKMDGDFFTSSFLCGCTKLVLFPKDLELVVKIPFNCSSETLESWDSETGEDIVEEYYFENAEGEEGWNYCAAEEYYYSEACSCGVEDAFLENKFIGYIKGHPIYIQKKVLMYEESEGTFAEKEESVKKSVAALKKDYLVSFPDKWAADFIEYYGEEKMRQLVEFLEDYVSHNDFHQGNLGYIEGRPVIVDYGGFLD